MPLTNWHTIRLELAETPEFPAGSAARAFLLRLPLDAAGALDARALARRPSLATFRRFWPSERDVRGAIVADGGGLSLRPEDAADHPCGVLPLRLSMTPGARLSLADVAGEALPFRVTAVERVGKSPHPE